jgi:Flp pilus assembly protein TadG
MQHKSPWSNGWSRFLRAQCGNIATISGLCMPLIVGFCGMASDVGYWLYESRVLQGAADIASYDAGVVLNNNGSSSLLTSTATADAKSNGWASSNGKITVNYPPTSGTYQGNSQAVEVILTENLPRFFTAIYSNSTLPIKARAVTYVDNLHSACVLALSATSLNAITITGNGDLEAPHCDVVSDSNAITAIDMSGIGKLDASCIVSVGSATTTAGLTLTTCKTATNNATAVADPYKDVVAPSVPTSPCITLSGKPSTISPGYYCHGLSISWGPVTFQPGTYYRHGWKFFHSGRYNRNWRRSDVLHRQGLYGADRRRLHCDRQCADQQHL